MYSCVFDVKDSGMNISLSVDLDILGVYNKLIAGKCASSDPVNVPFAKIFHSFADQMSGNILSAQEKAWSMDGKRKPVRDLVEYKRDSLTEVTYLGHTYTCASIATISNEMRRLYIFLFPAPSALDYR